MFNLSGSEIIVILLLALVVLGPEKLPDALRRAGRTYAELKKMGSSFQEEVRSALDEPVKEMRETADLLRSSIDVTDGPTTRPQAATPATMPNRRAPPATRPTTQPADGDVVDAVEHAPATDAGPRLDHELIDRTLSGTGASGTSGPAPADGPDDQPTT